MPTRIKMSEPERKESARLSQEKWRLGNPDKIAAYNLKFRQKNTTYFEEYFKTAQGRKVNRVNGWKQRGVIHPNFELLYTQYINTTHCTNCTVELCEGRKSNGRCLDHFHSDPVYPLLTNVRSTGLCFKCNIRRK